MNAQQSQQVSSPSGSVFARAIRRVLRLVSLRLTEVRNKHAMGEYYRLRRIARLLGYHLVPAGPYSPIFDLGTLPASTWEEPTPMPGVRMDLEAQLQMIDEELVEHLVEFHPPRNPPAPGGFYLNNPFYGPGDAELLYAMVRRHGPARVLELGAGYSTLVIAHAGERNAADGQPLSHIVVDPKPSPVLEGIADRIELRSQSADDVAPAEFAELKAGDMLFIDTTHTLKPGSEVLYLLLTILPTLRPGVLVHIHDVYRPFEYPPSLAERWGNYWQEHYLVQALLVFNDRFEIMCATHALWRLRRERMRELVPSTAGYAFPSSFWIRRLD